MESIRPESYATADVHKGISADIREFKRGDVRIVASAFDRENSLPEQNQQVLEKFYDFIERPDFDREKSVLLVEGQDVVEAAKYYTQSTDETPADISEMYKSKGPQIALAVLAMRSGVKVESWTPTPEEEIAKLEEEFDKKEIALWQLAASLKKYADSPSDLYLQPDLMSALIKDVEQRNLWQDKEFYNKFGFTDEQELNNYIRENFGFGLGDIDAVHNNLDNLVNLNINGNKEKNERFTKLKGAISDFRSEHIHGKKVNQSIESNNEVFVTCEAKYLQQWQEQMPLEESEVKEFELIDVETVKSINHELVQIDKDFSKPEDAGRRAEAYMKLGQEKFAEIYRIEVAFNRLCRKHFDGRNFNEQIRYRIQTAGPGDKFYGMKDPTNRQNDIGDVAEAWVIDQIIKEISDKSKGDPLADEILEFKLKGVSMALGANALDRVPAQWR